MNVVVAMDSWKGSLGAVAACAAAARGVRRAVPDARIDLCPLADGGEGTASVLHEILGGEWVEAEVNGPLPGRRLRAAYLRLGGDRPTAVIDLAAASGLTVVPRSLLDPLRATTLGTGELIRHAIVRGARRVWLALGGSATVDGAMGAATALGWRFLDAGGSLIGHGGGELERLARIVRPAAPFPAVRVVALRDVDNPLLGERGAARVFGPQKGATPEAIERLERGLDRLAAVIERDLGVDVRRLRGGGSAGGAGAGAAAFFGARLVGGAPLVLRLSGFLERIRRADLVITGEGRFDSQSLDGKVVSAVARLAARHAVPVAVVAGRVALDENAALAYGIRAIEAASPPEIGEEEALAHAGTLLEAAAERVTSRWMAPDRN
jgi:glycerate kinase